MTQSAGTFDVALDVPPRDDFASVVAAVADDVTARIAMIEEKRSLVRLAVTEAFALIVADAMAEAQTPIHLRFCAEDALCVSFHEHGLPIDADRAARDPRWHEVLQHADRAVWHWLGPRGTQLHLTFDRQAATVQLSAAPIAVESLTAAADQPYTIRRFEPDDARGVVRCFYAAYGYGYDVPAVYEPRRLCELNKAERYVSFVALDEAGEVAGHYALDRQPGAPIAEGCGAVVDPRHRGRHLLERLRSAAEEHARAIGLAAYFTEPVTDHAVTQKESEKFGAHITAISLGFSPRTMLAKHMDLSASGQRQSLTLYVKPLREPEPRAIYAPKRHREMLAQIYAQLQIPVQIRDGADAAGAGSLRAEVTKASQNATIEVDRVGSDTIDVAAQAVSDLAALGSLGVLYAMLPLNDPGTPALADALEERGFFFSGLAPWMCNGEDALRLQRLLQPIDTAELTIASDFGRRLLAYIDASMGRSRDNCSAAPASSRRSPQAEFRDPRSSISR